MSSIGLLFVQRLQDEAILPTRSHKGDAGLDLYAVEGFYLNTGEVQVIRTGIAVQIPHGYFGSIRGRSGLATKGIDVLGGVVDSGYRGEVKVTLVNHGNALHFRPGDRVAQLIIQPVETPEAFEVDHLDPADRGDAGHGSTGA